MSHSRPCPKADRIERIPVLHDNYVFLLHNGEQAVVVDPAVAAPVSAELKRHRLELVAILHTHHHSDHIGGTPDLMEQWPHLTVVAARADRDRIPFQTKGVAGGDRFTLLGRSVEVIEVPGHTRCHIAYHLPGDPGGSGQPGDLFCGDTLFAGGCGRLFEGSAAQMHASLQKLAALPDSTRVWCAHEYTLANLRWAAAEEPQDAAIADRLAAVRRTRKAGEATVPSTIALEKATNLFLRARDGRELAVRRQSKDHWTG